MMNPWNAHIQTEIGEKGMDKCSVLQAVTQINEASLRFVPGIVGIFRQ